MSVSASAAQAASAIVSKASIAAASAASAVGSHASPASPSTFTNDAWLNGTATLVGALVGGFIASWVAYKLQVRAARRRERENGLLQAHQLMFGLINQLNVIMLVWRDHFVGELNNRGRWMLVQPVTPFDLSRYVIDESKMSILLDCKEGRAVLYALSIAQEAYREALFVINERSRIHRFEFQPAIEHLRIEGDMVSDQDMIKHLGRRLAASLMGLTDNSYFLLHSTFDKLQAVKVAARNYLVARFETADITNVEFPDLQGINQPPPIFHKRA